MKEKTCIHLSRNKCLTVSDLYRTVAQGIIKLYDFPLLSVGRVSGAVGITAECLLRVKWSDQGSAMG